MAIQSSNPPDLTTIDLWKGLNAQQTRGTIDDQESWWQENLYQVAPGALRTMWGPSPPIYTAPSGLQIRRIFFGFYGNDLPLYGQPPPGRKGWMFLSDGSIDEVDLDTQEVTRIGGGQPIWNPVEPKYWADCVVWRPRWVGGQLGEIGGVLFGSPGGQHPGTIGGVWAWDGTTLYGPGDPAPDWLTYADVTGTDATIMPYGLPDVYAMAVFNARLWVAGKDVISWSAPTNGTDFSDVNGGGSVPYFGDRLVYTYTALAASGPYLFCFGDSSTDVISNVQLIGQGTPGSPFTTVFQYQSADPQIGHAWPRRVGRWGRYLAMNNRTGIWLMTGGDAQVISEKVRNVHMTIDTTQFYPTFAVGTIFGVRILFMNARMTDSFGVTRSFMLAWNGDINNGWFVCSQNHDLIEINQYEDSTVMIPYGTDGTNLYQLFWRPDPTLEKRLHTKSLRGKPGPDFLSIKNWKRVYMEVMDNTGTGVPAIPPPPQDAPVPEVVPHGVSIIGSLTCLGGAEGGTQPVSFELPMSMQEAGTSWPTRLSRTAVLGYPVSGGGIAAHLDLRSLSPDFTVQRLHLTSENRTFFGA